MNKNSKKGEQETNAVCDEREAIRAELSSIQSKLLDLFQMTHVCHSDVAHDAINEYLNTIKVEIELSLKRKKEFIGK